MAFKLLLMAALVFFDQGGQGQHAATVLASGAQLLVHARLEPFRSNVTNILQYMGTGLTFSMAFGGIMLSYMRLAQAEESLRLFGDERNASFHKYEDKHEPYSGHRRCRSVRRHHRADADVRMSSVEDSAQDQGQGGAMSVADIRRTQTEHGGGGGIGGGAR